MDARACGAAGDGRFPHIIISTVSADPVDSPSDGLVVVFCKNTAHTTVREKAIRNCHQAI